MAAEEDIRVAVMMVGGEALRKDQRSGGNEGKFSG